MNFSLFVSRSAAGRRTHLPSRLVAAVLALVIAPALAVTGPCQGNLVISQVYGSGGNTGAAYTNDFVELHNPGILPVNLNGWAIQYGGATGTTWTVGVLPNLNIAPGAYFLVQALGGPTGSAMPPADATVTFNMSGTAGKVALTNSTTPLSGACPPASAMVDLVGYGATANCFEGGAAAAGPANAFSSIKRAIDTCGDTNSNSADFLVVTPVPRNSNTAPQVCECTMNGTGAGAEMDYCVLQFPASISNVVTGTATPPIYAQVYEMGKTETAGANPAITAQIGYGPNGVDPSTQPGFNWFAATYNQQAMNNDEYQKSFIAPAPGTWRYASRFTADGVNWTYCDLDGAGANLGPMDFSPAQMGTMTVDSGLVAPQFISANNATFHPGANGSFAVAATGSPAPVYSVAGALPSGVNFDPMQGLLYGMPAAGTAGGYPLAITASNGVMPNATQSFALVVTPNCALDVDGNGAIDALTDGLLLLRAMFGLTGDSVIAGALGTSHVRGSWETIRNFLNLNCGTAFGP